MFASFSVEGESPSKKSGTTSSPSFPGKQNPKPLSAAEQAVMEGLCGSMKRLLLQVHEEWVHDTLADEILRF